MLFALALLACTNSPAPEAPAVPTTPAGRIGGAPILERPVVIGAISQEAVDAGISARRESIERCFEDARASEPELAGKVLVKFTITAEGAVSHPVVRSTSLRSPPVEACINEQLVQITYTPLESGVAYVTYPFTFPTTTH